MIAGRFRCTDHELMDGEGFSFDEYHRTMSELERINRLTRGYSPTIRAVARLARRARGARIRVLDVGFGYGDTLRALRRWAVRHGVALDLVGIDVHPWAKQLAEGATTREAQIDYRTGNVFALSAGERFDIVINALFMHHLSDDDVVRMLQWMTERASLGWFINDLHRHPVAYHFIRQATRLASRSRLIKNDAPLSVARAFRADDWWHYVRSAGVAGDKVRIQWHFPFRHGVLYVATV